MTQFLISFIAAIDDPTFTPIHVVSDPGYEVVTLCGYPAGQPVDRDDKLVADYTGIYGAEFACDNPRIAILPYDNNLSPVDNWSAYGDAVCAKMSVGPDSVTCGGWADYYPLTIDFSTVQPDERGVRTIHVDHGTIELWPTVTRATMRRALRNGTVEIGAALTIEGKVFPIVGSPEPLYRK